MPALVLAVSGGPDSTALMVLAARWCERLKSGPTLTAVTIDHGLRAESAREAAAVGRLAHQLGLVHRTLRWTGKKPSTGLQEAARTARYRLLAKAARETGATHILTAHTLDDQAETVLIRLTRGSGLTGLGGMQRTMTLHMHSGTPSPRAARGDLPL
jgi:tRNA(Ile)-lysidine synthase